MRDDEDAATAPEKRSPYRERRRAEEPLDSALVLPKRAVWPFFAAVFVAIAIGASFGYRAWTAPDPLRVFIAIEIDGAWWQGSETAEVVTKRLNERLGTLGFDVVAISPEVREKARRAKTPLDAARGLRAAFLVSAALTPEVIEHPVAGGYTELRVDAKVTVRHTRDDSVEEVPIAAFAGARDQAHGRTIFAEALADKTFDAVLGSMTRHPQIAKLFEGGGDPRLAGRISPARDYAKARDRRMAETESFYEKRRRDSLEREAGPVKVTYHSHFSAADHVAGLGDRGLLVHTSSVKPFLFPDTRDLGYYETLETLEWRDPLAPKASADLPLFRGYHVFGKASVSRDGSAVALVEDLFGWAKTITVAGPSRKPKRLRVDAEHRYVDPKISPGGKAIAVTDRACRTCADGLLVLAVDGGRALFELRGDDGAFSGMTWIDDAHLAFAFRPEADKKQRVMMLDLSASPPSQTLIVTGEGGDFFFSGVVTADKKTLILPVNTSAGQAYVDAIDLASRAVNRREVQGYVSSPAIAPDGLSVAFELVPAGQRWANIAVMTLATGAVRALTQNVLDDRSPVFSLDGSRIFYESRDFDPNFPRRVVGVLASVPAR